MTSKPAEIIIADDDLAFVKALSVRLEQAGYRVIIARDAYNALARAVESNPDVMILDIHMPAGDGFSVHERMDRMTGLMTVPVIYVTGDKSPQTARIASERGCAALLHKPFSTDDLIGAIERVLSGAATRVSGSGQPDDGSSR